MTSVLVASAVTVVVLMGGVWALSLVRRDASVVDLFWGFGFVLVAGVGMAVGPGEPDRQILVLLCTGVWGLRLSVYLTWRNAGKGEDFRYRAMRERWGDRFPIVSLATVFGLQGALMWIVSLPVQASMGLEGSRLGLLDWLGVTVWAGGLAFEAIGDAQLAAFKSDPANRGKVMDRGLWRYTRHPNYFGDAVVWWGLYLFALSAGGWWTIVGPLAMTFLLRRISGVPLLERRMARTKPGYAEYMDRTSAFFPRPPR